MITSSIVLGSLLLGGTAHAKKAPSNDWDPDAGKALEAKVRDMMAEIDKGNVGPFVSSLDTVTTSWDVGVKGNPLTASNPAESQKMLEDYAKWIKDEGVTVKSTIQKTDCHATATFGFCALEYDQMFTVKGEAMPVQKFRATLVSRNVDGDWRWAHWHASLREPMMPMTTMPPAPAQ
jgi:hypothetical protein